MCGIAGAIGWIDDGVMHAVERASAAQAHRGPDDHGEWRSTPTGQGAAFAFRRLAILDLSPDAHQPMVDPVSGNVLVFNGEIYNYKELRQQLIAAGETFRSSGDTEVLLKAYNRWGADAVRRLRGMFALAIWDARRRRVLMARDRLGIKPLYFSPARSNGNGATVVFASELRAILASGLAERRLSHAGLATYIWNGFVVGENSIVEGVKLLAAGTIMEVGDDGRILNVNRYWQMPTHGIERDGVARLKHQLHTSIEQHLASDVPLGIFLSGGIDSSAIAALAAKVNGKAIRTFNISFDEARYDESPHAKAVAAALGTEHSDIRLSEVEFRNRLPEALASLDQPTFDGINTYFVSHAVREAGMTVALAGTGGDELFGGYRSFVDNTRAARLCQFASILPIAWRRRIARQLMRMKYGTFGETPPQSRWGKLADVLATGGKPVDLHQVSYGMFTDDFLRDLAPNGTLNGTRSGLPEWFADELERLAGDRLDYSAVSRLELACFIGQRLLRDTDSVSMAASLEVRVPLLDHEVVEAAMHVEPDRRFKPLGKKHLLRELALHDLDPAIFDRPKAGFELPIDVWCRRQLKDELENALTDKQRCEAVGLNPDAVGRLWRSFKAGAPGIYWSRVWSLFVLLHWCRSHCVTIA